MSSKKKNENRDILVGGALSVVPAAYIGYKLPEYTDYLQDKFYKDEGGHINSLKDEKNKYKPLTERQRTDFDVLGNDELSRKADDHIFRMKKALRRADNSNLLDNEKYKSKLDELKKASSAYAEGGFKDDSKSQEIDTKINDLNSIEEASTVADKPSSSFFSLSDFVSTAVEQIPYMLV